MRQQDSEHKEKNHSRHLETDSGEKKLIFLFFLVYGICGQRPMYGIRGLKIAKVLQNV